MEAATTPGGPEAQRRRRPFRGAVLIGGAPGVGKSTLARALGRLLDVETMSLDDLMRVAQAVTTAESHPGLHVTRRRPHVHYFTDSSWEELVADAESQHQAAWPLVTAMLEQFERTRRGLVLEGWHLLPERVAKLPDTTSLWLVVTPQLLYQRESSNMAWMKGSRDPQRMLKNFFARSLLHNEKVRTGARRLGLPMLEQDGSRSVEELCRVALQVVEES